MDKKLSIFYFVRVLGATDNVDTIEYTLKVTLTSPPTCDVDDLGDTAMADNDSPANAFDLEITPTGEWPASFANPFEFPTDSMTPSQEIIVAAIAIASQSHPAMFDSYPAGNSELPLQARQNPPNRIMPDITAKIIRCGWIDCQRKPLIECRNGSVDTGVIVGRQASSRRGESSSAGVRDTCGASSLFAARIASDVKITIPVIVKP